MDKLASRIAGCISNVVSGGKEIALHLYIDGEEVKNVVVKRINQDIASGKEVIII